MATAASRLLQLLPRPATRRISAQPRAYLSSTPSSPSSGVQLVVEKVEDAVPNNEVGDGNPPTDQQVVDDVEVEALGLKAPSEPGSPKQSDGQFKHHGQPPAAGQGGGSHHH